MYVASAAQRQAIGRSLLEGLIAASEAEGFWTLQAHIFAINTASRGLFARAGFRQIGVRERFGHLDGHWHDVVLIERRSRVTGGPGLKTRICDRG